LGYFTPQFEPWGPERGLKIPFFALGWAQKTSWGTTVGFGKPPNILGGVRGERRHFVAKNFLGITQKSPVAQKDKKAGKGLF